MTPAACHPDEPVIARGLCSACYCREHYHGRLHLYPSKRNNADRFWDRVERTSDCWPWTGRLVNGYGRIKWEGRAVYVHRIAYGLLIGPIPADMVVDHLCRNRACCNPAHMEVVFPRVNTLRGEGVGMVNSRKTHCPKGHPYDYVLPSTGARMCRACHLQKTSAWRRKRRESERTPLPRGAN